MSDFKRTITHWTGGGGRANSTDKRHYHRITEHDGNVVKGNEKIEDNIVTSDGDYAAHTRNLNTGSIGLAMAGMMDATEYPLNFGPAPITRTQFEAHCRLLAEIHTEYRIPVTPQTCLTHAEVEPTLGVKQRNKWDITVLQFEPTIRGAIPIGDYMRERVKFYMGADYPQENDYPIVRQGSRGRFVEELQELLMSARYFPGKADGIFGNRTRDALMSFQADNELKIDGIAGSQTWAALMNAKSAPMREITMGELKDEGSKTIKSADEGQAVITLGGGATAALATLDQLTGAKETVSEAEGVLDTLQAMLFQYWPLIVIGIMGALLWRHFNGIKRFRLFDAITGKNMGR